MAKVSLQVKYLSNKNYVREVSVEGKHADRFFFKFGFYNNYVLQVIRIGNCITLLSSSFDISRDNFWNTHYFEDITRFTFWTFNKSFLLILTEKLQKLTPTNINRCHELLSNNFVPYNDSPTDDDPDEELAWCIIKNGYLLKDEKFKKLYALDKQNRIALLEELSKRNDLINRWAGEKKESMEVTDPPLIKEHILSFMEILNPTNGSAEETLRFIEQKTSEANFEFKIFSLVVRFPNGKNQYGLNGCIAAAIDFFYQLGYFKNDYNLLQIFKAYSSHTGNTIGKLKVFISEFRHDNSYIKHTAKLKALKIHKYSQILQ